MLHHTSTSTLYPYELSLSLLIPELMVLVHISGHGWRFTFPFFWVFDFRLVREKGVICYLIFYPPMRVYAHVLVFCVLFLGTGLGNG